MENNASKLHTMFHRASLIIQRSNGGHIPVSINKLFERCMRNFIEVALLKEDLLESCQKWGELWSGG